jgi:hypothetical protein
MQKISWQAPEYIHTEKSADWYWIVGIITFSIALIAIILNNLIFGILIIISSITLSLYAARPAKMIDMEINDAGVKIGSYFYPYSELESFWIETEVRHPKIILKSRRKVMFFVSILIEDADPEELDELLSQHLPKVEHSEPILEKLLVYLGF